jgi:hypothetical protein
MFSSITLQYQLEVALDLRGMLIASQTSTLIYLLVCAVSMALSAVYLAWRTSRRDRRRRENRD